MTTGLTGLHCDTIFTAKGIETPLKEMKGRILKKKTKQILEKNP